MKKEKYIKIPKGYFKKLNYKINWDWDLFFKIKRLAILKSLLGEIRCKNCPHKTITKSETP